jgi:hypothetical protein
MPEELLFINTLTFYYPNEKRLFYFSLKDRTDCVLTKLNHTLFPQNIKDIFPDITNGNTLYTSFDREIDSLQPLGIDFNLYVTFNPQSDLVITALYFLIGLLCCSLP